MRVIFLSLICLLTSTLSFSQTIHGLWNTNNENTKIEIHQEDGEWLGKIMSSDNEKAPIGKIILKDLEKQGELWNGKLFVIKKQRWVNVKITPNESKLDLLVSAGFFSQKVQWTKAK